MDKRYQVFVSSTYTDLVEERSEIIQVLLEQDCLPAAMEMFPAANDDQWTLIKEVIDQSDYYIVVVGGRYGSLSEEGISYTEREYDYAVSAGKPVLGFVHGAPETIAAGKTDQDDAAREKLAAFRAKVQTRLTKEFTSPAELGSVVLRSLSHLIKKQPGEGWVRARHAMTPETTAELADLRARVAQLSLEKLAATQAEEADVVELARGDESVEVDYRLQRSDLFEETWEPGTWVYTWNQLLRLLGPAMLDEVTEAALRRRLESDLERKLDTGARQVGPLAVEIRVQLEHGAWDQVKMQLRALGLIDKGNKRRAVGDGHMYWRLTERGEHDLVRLLALKTGQTRSEELPGPDIDRLLNR